MDGGGAHAGLAVDDGGSGGQTVEGGAANGVLAVAGELAHGGTGGVAGGRIHCSQGAAVGGACVELAVVGCVTHSEPAEAGCGTQYGLSLAVGETHGGSAVT